ncbi:baseplate J/gp47 family protein [Candidatus Igneacidithiobacillus taiwanensis]|uniref:baseplate J/gp47 family protein n=1 Tax=Candidatus Igneacidithiobacillus taiwanensis TaxID=1945924 RepID=UPI0028A051FB|nr:baseplate J/gp47 family protein [Candidatus Igneacidithiobacillus taiwanensis]
MAAQSGVITDYNKGSQIRTISEALGMIQEMQGIISSAEAFQSAVYGAMSAFGVTPNPASAAVGQVIFATSFAANPPTVGVSVLIPSGTLVQTISGVQFVTTQTAVLPAGSSSITVPIQAVQTGTGGNVAAGTITQLVSGLSYPLAVSNPYPTSGGAAQETIESTLQRFAAVVAAINGASPVAVANAAIGVTVASTGETVQYATCYEGWIAQMNAGETPTAGYAVYVDNGSGTASQNLLNAVTSTLNGSFPTLPGNRPAGVPYTVNAVVPLAAVVVVSGTPVGSATAASLTTQVQSAMTTLFNALQFGQALTEAQVTAAVANAVGGGVSGLTVTLENSSGATVAQLSPLAYERIILQTLTVNFGS